MTDEDILAEAAKMVLTDKVPEQPYIRGCIMDISQNSQQMFYVSSPYTQQIELEVTMRITVDANDNDKIHRIIHGGRILIMEDKLG